MDLVSRSVRNDVVSCVSTFKSAHVYAQKLVPAAGTKVPNELLFSGFPVSHIVEEALQLVHFLVNEVFAIIRNTSRRSDWLRENCVNIFAAFISKIILISEAQSNWRRRSFYLFRINASITILVEQISPVVRTNSNWVKIKNNFTEIKQVPSTINLPKHFFNGEEWSWVSAHIWFSQRHFTLK